MSKDVNKDYFDEVFSTDLPNKNDITDIQNF